MRIGVVCFSTVGGSGIVATEIGLALAKRGHDVHFFANDKPWRFDDSAHFHRELGGVELDVIHVHYAVPHAVLARRAYPATPMVVTLHGTDVTRIQPDADTRAVVKSSTVTVPSSFLRQEAQRVYGVDAHVIGNFVDTQRFTPGPLPRAQVVFHASNFRPVKRTADVVRVFSGLPGVLRMAGDGPDRAETELLAQGLGLRAEFLGPRKDIEALLKDARVFLLPSETESFGLAALEAQSAGVPVVASNVGGVGEVVRDGHTGFLHPVGDVAAMAASTQRLLSDDQLFEQFAAASRENAQRFAKEAHIDAYEALLKGSP